MIRTGVVEQEKKSLSKMTGGRFKDKVVIVTGGSKGIGRGCVDVFGKALVFK